MMHFQNGAEREDSYLIIYIEFQKSLTPELCSSAKSRHASGLRPPASLLMETLLLFLDSILGIR